MANEHSKCIIGLLHLYDCSELATIDTLKEYIAESHYHNEVLVPLYSSPENRQSLMRKTWELADYADWRKSTNLTRFSYCPMCGKAIDWKEIRRAEDGK